MRPSFGKIIARELVTTMPTAKSILLSPQTKAFANWIETHVPFVRQWHRFAYEEHFFRVAKWDRLFHGVYPDFATAAKAIPKRFNFGYDNADAATFLGQNASVRSSDYPVLFWLNRLLPENNRILDFGGYLGISYRAYKPLLSYPPDLTWTIYDVPAVVAKGKELLASHPDPRLSFTTNFAEAADADVLLAAGSLQFCERDFSEYLADLPRLPRHLLINKTPMTDGEQYVTLHSMGVALTPYRIFQQKQFIDSLAKLGYRLIDQWKNEDFACIIPFELDKSVNAFSGMYLTLEESARK